MNASVAWGCAGSAYRDEAESGDRHVLKLLKRRVLAGVIDGIGHGREAAAASRAATELIEACAGDPLGSLFRRCHERLRPTRGTVMTLAAFDPVASSIEWLGVGNVRAVLVRADPGAHPAQVELLVRSGVVGLQLPSLAVSSLPVARNDTLVLATDGIGNGFAGKVVSGEDPQVQAERILQQYRTGRDDALVLVMRCGRRHP